MPRTPNQTGIISKTMENTNNHKAQQERPVSAFNRLLNVSEMRKLFENAVQDNSGAFIASLIDLYDGDTDLQLCDPKAVAMEALKAASLKLPINKALGFAYIIPYRDKCGVMVPQFRLGYRGMIQLCLRSNAYRYINADCLYEGESVALNRLTGMIVISGTKNGEKVIGYFSYFQLLNGFEKATYWTREAVEAHAVRYSKSYSSSKSAWVSNFDEMATKTVLRDLLGHYGVMSTEFSIALEAESVLENTALLRLAEEPTTIPEPPPVTS